MIESQRPVDPPRPSIADMQRLTAAELSLPSRLVHTLLLAVSLTMVAAIGSLWATEPSLPFRTHIAFGCIVSIALAWAMFAGWVLARRRVLLGADRVLAAKIGVTFSALAALGLGALGYWGNGGRGAYLGALAQSGVCGVAWVLLIRAQRRFDDLKRRRRRIEEQFPVVHAISSDFTARRER
jgi:hypothetical protein